MKLHMLMGTNSIVLNWLSFPSISAIYCLSHSHSNYSFEGCVFGQTPSTTDVCGEMIVSVSDSECYQIAATQEFLIAVNESRIT